MVVDEGRGGREEEGDLTRFWAKFSYPEQDGWIGSVHPKFTCQDAVFPALEEAKAGCEVMIATALVLAQEQSGRHEAE